MESVCSRRRSLAFQRGAGGVEVGAGAFMECERDDLLHGGRRASCFGEAAVGIKRLVDGALVVKHEVRVVPLSAELEGRGVVSHVLAEVIVGVKCRRSALEIGARTFLKTSGHAEAVVIAALGAESAFAGDIGKGMAAAKPGRDGDVDRVVARGVGMHASPAGPFGIEMKMAAHEEGPWGKDRVHGKGEAEGQQCERPELEQQVAAFARGCRARKDSGLLCGVDM
jgi:hypothetical protein